MGRQYGATGYVKWPEGVEGWRDCGEGGMWVAAFWPANFSIAEDVPLFDPAVDGLTDEDRAQTFTYSRDSFVRCHGPEATIALPFPDSVASGQEADRIYRDPADPPPEGASRQQVEQYAYNLMDAAHPVLGALVLGTSATAWVDAEGSYWSASTEELTSRGRALVVALNTLYDRPPVVVTYLDT